MKRTLLPQEIHEMFADGVVRHGPLAGLKYPELISIGALYPKLLGSYESELHPWIEEVCDTGYSEVIDVGCAEGYYAVGLARRISQCMVYAYDTYAVAQELCARFAAANQVLDRIRIRASFSADDLSDIPIRRRGLILCDCEGGETQIFTEQARHRFADWDLLIEAHDFIDIGISTHLSELFQGSHQIRAIASVDDIQKAKTYQYPELEDLDLATRKIILAEYRPTIMEWLFLKSRSA